MAEELMVGLALVLVLEGLLPFGSPALLRRMMLQMAQTDDRALRVSGLISMLLGLGLLYLVRR